ncbi:hypothetical protein [Streptomyces cadmiisoli]|uniref:Uncharacterized protein n=1 Tax=Streptomyces cadmiisoli TaxID=2184053 RepID=A0A2Z4J735_9ACTN|nr:hypothetical protein [Streptomyces cadmiisoli]AWW40951.1 hypothetical protein DN051_33280 [Streptomyces cadmiisoli]
MTAGRGFRVLRAVVFAAVCVISAALGHVLMSGHGPSWWLLLGAGTAVAGTTWSLAGRECRRVVVAVFAVATQAGLHGLFMLTHAATMPGPEPGTAGRAASMSHSGAGHTARGLEPSGHGLHTAPGSPAHGIDASFLPGTLGMLAVHLLAALLCGLWLALGEGAAFRVLRALAARLAAPLRLLRRPPVPKSRPRPPAPGARSERVPWRLAVPRALTTRGPPAPAAAVLR